MTEDDMVRWLYITGFLYVAAFLVPWEWPRTILLFAAVLLTLLWLYLLIITMYVWLLFFVLLPIFYVVKK